MAKARSYSNDDFGSLVHTRERFAPTLVALAECEPSPVRDVYLDLVVAVVKATQDELAHRTKVAEHLLHYGFVTGRDC